VLTVVVGVVAALLPLAAAVAALIAARVAVERWLPDGRLKRALLHWLI
jgi:hypothetical protein